MTSGQSTRSSSDQLATDIERLIHWNSQLIAEVEPLIAALELSDEAPAFDWLSVFFVRTQTEHVRSILNLGMSMDCWLIGRSMLEGMTQYLFAAQQPEARATRFRNFVWVLDWRKLLENVEAGRAVDPDVRRRIEQGLADFGDEFLTKKGRKAREECRPLSSNSFSATWTGMSAKDLFVEVSAQLLHTEIYRRFSDWHHWSPNSLGHFLVRDETGVRYDDAPKPRQYPTALAVAFQCLYQVAEIAARGTDSEIEESLKATMAGYASDLAHLTSR